MGTIFLRSDSDHEIKCNKGSSITKIGDDRFISLDLELYNQLNFSLPKLHYSHSQFLRICKKHDTRIFPQVRVTSVESCVQQKFPTVDPNQPQTAVLLPPACQPLESNLILVAEASCKTSRNDVSHTSSVVFRPVSRGIKAEWKDSESTRYHTSLNKTRSTSLLKG